MDVLNYTLKLSFTSIYLADKLDLSSLLCVLIELDELRQACNRSIMQFLADVPQGRILIYELKH